MLVERGQTRRDKYIYIYGLGSGEVRSLQRVVEEEEGIGNRRK
jgi:hypothetical protein